MCHQIEHRIFRGPLLAGWILWIRYQKSARAPQHGLVVAGGALIPIKTHAQSRRVRLRNQVLLARFGGRAHGQVAAGIAHSFQLHGAGKSFAEHGLFDRQIAGPVPNNTTNANASRTHLHQPNLTFSMFFASTSVRALRFLCLQTGRRVREPYPVRSPRINGTAIPITFLLSSPPSCRKIERCLRVTFLVGYFSPQIWPGRIE